MKPPCNNSTGVVGWVGSYIKATTPVECTNISFYFSYNISTSPASTGGLLPGNFTVNENNEMNDFTDI